MKGLIFTSSCYCSIYILKANSDFCKYKWKTRYAHQKSIQWKIHIIKIYFTWMKKINMIKIFLTEYKFILTEWKYILISRKKSGDIMKIYFIEYKFVLIEWKKGDIMKICFIKYKIILIGWKYVFISYEFSFLQHLSNHYCWDIFAGVPKNSILRKQGLNKKTIKN